MSLINVFQLQQMRPHVGYRFHCEIWPYGRKREETNYLSFTVKKVSQPVFKLSTDNRQYYGNTQYVIPVMDFGQTELSITFEETDEMGVYKFLADYQIGFDAYLFTGRPLLNVEITQFDETMVREVDKTLYICYMKSYDTPSFNNNAAGTPVDITASFYVEYVSRGSEEPKLAVDSETNRRKRAVADDIDDFSSEIAKANSYYGKVEKPATAPKTQKDFKKPQKIDSIDEKLEKINAENQHLLRDEVYSLLEGKDPTAIFAKTREAYEDKMLDGSTDVMRRKAIGDEFRTIFNESTPEEKTDLVMKYWFGIDATNGLDEEEINIIRALKEAHGELDFDRVETNIARAKQLMEQKEKARYIGDQAVTSVSDAKYSRETYEQYKDMSLSEFRRMKSNGYCAAYTSTELSKLLGLDKRLDGAAMGKQFVSTNMVDQINKTGKGTAKIRNDITITSMDDLRKLQKDRPEGVIYVVSIDIDPAKTMTQAERAGFSQRSLEFGHVVTLSEDGVNQGQNTPWTYSGTTDELIQSGKIRYRVMEIRKNPE